MRRRVRGDIEGGVKLMADTNPARALDQVKRIVELCDFIEHPATREAIEQKIVPAPMPRVRNAVVDMSVWVGLGIVGLWAALDAFAERAELNGSFREWFRGQANEGQSLMELEDIRHLHAHNYAGEADEEYFNSKYRRHVLKSGKVTQLTCGAQFNGHRLSLDLQDLRYYACTVRRVLERFS
jgi:hypothetical protein